MPDWQERLPAGMDVLVVGEPMVLDETGKPAALVLRDVPV
jgi:hypothetical protein